MADEAPERIYQLVPAPEAGPFMSRRVEYVRADLVAAQVRKAWEMGRDAAFTEVATELTGTMPISRPEEEAFLAAALRLLADMRNRTLTPPPDLMQRGLAGDTATLRQTLEKARHEGDPRP